MAEEKKGEKKDTEQPKEGKVEEKNEQPKEEKKEAPVKKEKAPGPAKVNYVHAALLLHSAGKEISEASLKKVVEAAGAKAEDAQIKALVASLEGMNIEEAISQAVAAPVAAPAGGETKEKKEEKKEEDTEKKAEEAAAGLSSLFG